MRNTISIVSFGLLIPIGIILAGNADSTGLFWSGIAMAVFGFIGSVAGIYQRHVEIKSQQSGNESTDPTR